MIYHLELVRDGYVMQPKPVAGSLLVMVASSWSHLGWRPALLLRRKHLRAILVALHRCSDIPIALMSVIALEDAWTTAWLPVARGRCLRLRRPSVAEWNMTLV